MKDNLVMQRVLSISTTVLAIILLPVVFMMLLSWNSLPGQRLYAVKRTMESLPRFVLFFDQKASSTYEVKLAGRRLDEAASLIKSPGYDSQEIAEVLSGVKDAEGLVLSSQNEEAKQELVGSLQTYRDKLDRQRTSLTQEIHLLTSPLAGTQLTNPDLQVIQYRVQTIETITKTIDSIDATIKNLQSK